MKDAFETYTFPSADGVSQCAGIAVMPEDEPKMLLMISHGMAEYMKRYLPFMQTLAAHGILCFGHDHIGHGYTVKDTDDLGYLPRKNGAEFLVSDVICDAKRFSSCYPDVPLVLFGHSMGSFIARIAAAEDRESLFDGMILSGTGGGNPAAPIALSLLTVLCAVKGERAYSKFMDALMFGSYNKRFENKTPFDWLTTDPSLVAKYLDDPYCGFPFTVSALYVLVSLLKTSNSRETFVNTPKDLPIFLVSGRDDPVGNYGDGVHETADAYQFAGCTAVSHTLYTGARHELLNEPIADQVIRDLLGWLDTHIHNHPKRSTPT